MAGFVIDLQPLERCGLRRIEPEFPDRFAEEFALFRMVVETARLYLFGPPSYFRWRLFLAALIEPLDYLLVACALLDLRFEIVALHALETEKHVIERTIEMIFPDIPGDQGATFINSAAEDCVTADPDSRTSRRLLGQILTHDVFVHPSR